MEKISLDIPPVVVFEDENWNVGKVNHLNSSVDIWRNLKVKVGDYEYYDIETRTVGATELYKADTTCMAVHKMKDFGGRQCE